MNAKPWSIFRRSTCGRAALASLVLGFGLAVPVVTLADRPATMPAFPRADRPDPKDRADHDRRSDRDKGDKGDRGGDRSGDNRSGDNRGGDRGERFGPRREFRISDEEWAEAAAFMADHSPTMWGIYEKLHDKHKAAAKNNIARRYLSLKKLEERDRTLYAIELKRVRVEDDIFKVLGEIRKVGEDREGQKQLKEKLHRKVEELWDVRMEDREVQLERIERQLQGLRMGQAVKALQDERQAAAAPERKAGWVQERYEMFLGLGNMGGRPGMPGGRGRQDGPPPRGGERAKEGERTKEGERKTAGPSANDSAGPRRGDQ